MRLIVVAAFLAVRITYCTKQVTPLNSLLQITLHCYLQAGYRHSICSIGRIRSDDV